jgi:hypothetical protein
MKKLLFLLPFAVLAMYGVLKTWDHFRKDGAQ